MKNRIYILLMVCVFFSCKNEVKSSEQHAKKRNTTTYTSIGKSISDADVASSDVMMTRYKQLEVGDTITAKMKGKIVDVCAKKGCWMTLAMADESHVMVRFKDYGFFVPTDAKGEVVVNGKAFITETPVSELRHYAEDAGKSKSEIEAIIAPKLEYRFEADGVLLKGD